MTTSDSTGLNPTGSNPTGPSACAAGCRPDDDPRKVRSRARVIEAATEIMVELGPRAVTVDAVSERSGVAKSTIYRHWDSRAAIVVEVIGVHMPSITPPETDDFAAALETTLNTIADAMADPQWARILPAFASLQVSMPEVAALSKADSDHKMKVFRRLLQIGVDEGRLMADLDEVMLLHLLVGPIVMATLGGYSDRVHDTARAVASQFLAAHPRR